MLIDDFKIEKGELKGKNLTAVTATCGGKAKGGTASRQNSSSAEVPAAPDNNNNKPPLPSAWGSSGKGPKTPNI